MSEFFYQSGWGAFTMMLLMQLPFAIIFLWVVYRKAFASTQPSDAPRSRFARVEGTWLVVVGVVFFLVNFLSIEYFPALADARAVEAGSDIQEVDVTARSWAYEMSDRELEAGKPVRFNVRSADTMHSFTVYHPDGRILFTVQLIPGVKQDTSRVFTFKDPGTYQIRCLEYCGIAHHGMRDQLVVVANQG